MVGFAVAMLGVLLLAGITWIPPLLGKNSGVHATEPGLLTVDPAAQGQVIFQDGASVALYPSGFRFDDAAGALLYTVVKGSPVSALTGSVTGSGGNRREELTTVVSNAHIARLEQFDGLARYTGELYDDSEKLRRHLVIDIAESSGRFRFIVHVTGAQAIVIHLKNDPDTRGYTPSVPDRSLARRAWWIRNYWPASTTIFTTYRGASVALGPATVNRALDLREAGRTDVHIWAAQAEIGLTRVAPPVQDS